MLLALRHCSCGNLAKVFVAYVLTMLTLVSAVTAEPVSARLKIDASGISTFKPGDLFFVKQFEKKFGKFQTKSSKTQSDGIERLSFEVLESGKILFSILADEAQKKIDEIRVHSAHVKNTLGLNITSKLASKYEIEDLELCSTGHEELSGLVVCEDKVHKNFLYVFEGEKLPKNGEFPVWEDLQNWQVTEIIMREK